MKQGKRVYEKLSSRHALSVVETICILCLTAFAVIGLCLGFLYYRDSMRRGSDNQLMKTAERTALLNTAGGGCVVKDCDGKDDCIHITDGISTGYFDHGSNTIVAEIPAGYNEYRVMTVAGESYYGDRGTMVIKVEYDGENCRLSWVKGR